MSEALLAVRGLTVETESDPSRPVVHGLDLDVDPGEMVALVGESGSGKTASIHGILGLLPRGLRRTAGTVSIGGSPRGSNGFGRSGPGRLGLVMQDPLTALDPVMRVGPQIMEGARASRGLNRTEARELAFDLLRRVAMDDPERQFRSYPKELSGGQRQRVMIAAALAVDPVVLLCDEPTTALDVTIQRQVMELLTTLCADLGIGILIVTHDMGLATRWCARTLVMFGGALVESGATEEVLQAPLHPYTARLVGAGLTTSREDSRGAAPASTVGDLDEGCSFRTECIFGREKCARGPRFGVSGEADRPHLGSCIRVNRENGRRAT